MYLGSLYPCRELNPTYLGLIFFPFSALYNSFELIIVKFPKSNSVSQTSVQSFSSGRFYESLTAPRPHSNELYNTLCDDLAIKGLVYYILTQNLICIKIKCFILLIKVQYFYRKITSRITDICTLSIYLSMTIYVTGIYFKWCVF